MQITSAYAFKGIELGQIALNLESGETRVGLKINTNKTNVLDLVSHRILTISINGQNIKGFGQFVYLGSIVSADGQT